MAWPSSTYRIASAVVGLLEPLTMLTVTTDEYDEDYYGTRDLTIETLARGLEP